MSRHFDQEIVVPMGERGIDFVNVFSAICVPLSVPSLIAGLKVLSVMRKIVLISMASYTAIQFAFHYLLTMTGFIWWWVNAHRFQFIPIALIIHCVVAFAAT